MDNETYDDEIIKEIPVYLSNDAMKLLLLHYPTRLSKNDQLLSSNVTQCKYKSECEELEISYALDTDNNYDKGHGQELAAEMDKTSKDKSSYPSGMVDHLSFESHNTSSNTTDMIMYTSGKSIHLCPLKKTMNMLPKLSHIDKIDPKDESKKSSQNESEEEDEESEQIMAKFKDRPGKKSEKKKMQEMVKQRAMEPWIDLNFVPNGHYFSRGELEKFMLPYSNGTDLKDPDITITKVEKEVINENINAIRSRQLSKNEIKSYSLEKKIKILLFNAKMISTKMLINLLHKCGVPSDESVITILTHLKEMAVLVRGNWTLKSEELYPDNTISAHFGLSFEVMRLLRDYIIHLLDSDQIVNRKNIGKIFNAPPEEVKDVLNSVAVLDKTKTWRLLVTDNDGFLETVDNYKEICKEQSDWWTTRVKQINTWLEHKPKKNSM
ncbi:DNA-directed RNA polymerase III subunit RPC5-like [Metopolophium dirhodum]|uniref:DNA-directed RNA polymerase III subunit RPC5-like n=1 Tax=Metopolophium dirhodum TaxID=44670 RepID=UPI0029902A39|nr:DNA-directed RNA polymerase III subunit RPC5-like [Metopolophium dirhodum]